MVSPTVVDVVARVHGVRKAHNVPLLEARHVEHLQRSDSAVMCGTVMQPPGRGAVGWGGIQALGEVQTQ